MRFFINNLFGVVAAAIQGNVDCDYISHSIVLCALDCSSYSRGAGIIDSRGELFRPLDEILVLNGDGRLAQPLNA
jgi:hypothetical protein